MRSEQRGDRCWRQIYEAKYGGDKFCRQRPLTLVLLATVASSSSETYCLNLNVTPTLNSIFYGRREKVFPLLESNDLYYRALFPPG